MIVNVDKCWDSPRHVSFALTTGMILVEMTLPSILQVLPDCRLLKDWCFDFMVQHQLEIHTLHPKEVAIPNVRVVQYCLKLPIMNQLKCENDTSQWCLRCHMCHMNVYVAGAAPGAEPCRPFCGGASGLGRPRDPHLRVKLSPMPAGWFHAIRHWWTSLCHRWMAA